MNTRERVERFILDALFPKICISCAKYLDEERTSLLCQSCRASIPIHEAAFRDRGIMIASATNYRVSAVERLVYALKYDRIEAAASIMEEILTLYADRIALDLTSCVLIPIPLHPARLRKRGFNQAEVIARAIARRHGSFIESALLVRTRSTEPQARTSSRSERKKNLQGCFAVAKDKDAHGLEQRDVLLVDDVYTTGTTIQEAASALKKANIRNVRAFVFARTE